MMPHRTSCALLPGRAAAAPFPVSILLAGLLIILQPAAPALPGAPFSPSSIAKGVLLVASPALEDPNFSQTVLLIVEHGSGGSLGLVLNRSTNILLSDALPDLPLLKGTTHRLFAGGPVERTRLLMLFRLKEASAGARPVFDGVYVGDSPDVLTGLLAQAKPAEAFKAFAGYAGWGPGQLEFELLKGAWAILPPDASSIFNANPATLWTDSISRLQAPRVISY